MNKNSGIILMIIFLMIIVVQMCKAKKDTKNQSTKHNKWTIIEVDFTKLKGEGGDPWEKVSFPFKDKSSYLENRYRFKIYVNPWIKESLLRCVIPFASSIGLDYYDTFSYYPESLTNIRFTTAEYKIYRNVQTVTYITIDALRNHCYRTTLYLNKSNNHSSYIIESGKILNITRVIITNYYKYFWELN